MYQIDVSDTSLGLFVQEMRAFAEFLITGSSYTPLVSNVPRLLQKKRALMMVKTRRSLSPASPSQVVPVRTQKRRKQIETLLKRNQGGQTQQEVSFSVLATLFCRSIEGFWFRILPSDDGFDDICTATGLPW